MLRKTLLIICSGIALLTVGCTFKTRFVTPPVGFKSVAYYPKYFCSGEKILFEYIGQNIDKIRIQKKDGSNLLEMLGESGSGITPSMLEEWLPLSVKMFSSYGDRDESLKDKIVNIDSATWTVIYMSSSEIREGDQILDHVESVQEHDSETNSIVNIKIYDVYQNFAGFRWDISLIDFGVRAALLEVKNEGDQSLVFRLPGGDQTLTPAQSASISGFPYPSGRITAHYTSVQRRLVGRQKGERTKPENEHFTFENLYAENKYPLRLKVICKSATP